MAWQAEMLSLSSASRSYTPHSLCTAMNSGIPSLDDLNPTPDEKRLSRIAAEIWGVSPVRCDDDGNAHPLLREIWVDNHDKKMQGKLGRLGVFGIFSTRLELTPEEGGWTPMHVADGAPVMWGGTYRYIEAVGLVYKNSDSEYTDLADALLMTLDFERNGTPMERPHKLGAGPAIDLESWRSEFTYFF